MLSVLLVQGQCGHSPLFWMIAFAVSDAVPATVMMFHVACILSRALVDPRGSGLGLQMRTWSFLINRGPGWAGGASFSILLRLLSGPQIGG